ncbi:hypothetical protein BHE97_16645 [Aeromicrobium sp. PE09-221]|uniref:histidine phosphatase family protein n=1 Tax=Aeromicrobium sp. PE09-221 TaxID=1898043 RepID=UPI000B3EDEAA|nr:histidine phosphatase family protein [Aeromicrobium sp. PE09-221]OUZ07573.1 hypothetical protein BHE97_16645 [Aeromicrobium sp. PE09-221]
MILWLRHGESTWNAAGRMQYDVLHPELTERGRAQASTAAALLADRGIVQVWASPAVRAQQTGRIAAEELGLDLCTSPLLVEQAGGETSEDVADRVRRFADEVTGSGPVLAVSHGDTIAVAADVLARRRIGIIANAEWIETP